MLKKNDIVKCEITDYSSDGNGVAKIDGLVIFVPDSAAGDICEIKILKVLSGYGFGKIEKIISPSAERQPSPCPISHLCGGCDFQHITYREEKKAKHNFVKAAFERIGKLDCTVLPTKSMDIPDRYRNKAQFPVGPGADGQAVTGFYARRSHRLVPCSDCLLQPKDLNEIAQHCVNFMNELGIKAYDETDRSGIVRHIYLRKGCVTGQIMVCLVCTKADFPQLGRLCEKLKEKFPAIHTIVINVNNKNTNVILGEKNRVVFGPGKITDILCGVEIEISPHSFYQVNHDGAQKLYETAKESLELTQDDILLDMYCGTGSIGLSMADKVKQLVGVEIIPQAVENAKINAAKMNAVNTRFICADAKQAAKQLLEEKFLPTAVVVDPPRKGCDQETLDAIIQMNPPKISMISCNPSTAARDCKYLCRNGYKVDFVQPFDMFPRTKHVETVVVLSKLNSKKHINIEIHTDELDLTKAEAKGTYDDIKDYIREKYDTKVSSLNIAQVKEKLGIKERENYNFSKNNNKQPNCTKEKEEMIIDALKHFKMI